MSIIYQSLSTKKFYKETLERGRRKVDLSGEVFPDLSMYESIAKNNIFEIFKLIGK